MSLTGVVDLDFKSALADLKSFRRALKETTHDSTKVKIALDDSIAKGVNRLKKDLDGLVRFGKKATVDIKATAEAKQAIESLGQVKSVLGDIGKNPRVTIHVDDKEARASVKEAISGERAKRAEERETARTERLAARERREADRAQAVELRKQKELGASLAREIEAGYRRQGVSINRYGEEVRTVTGYLKKLTDEERRAQGAANEMTKKRTGQVSAGKSARGELADKFTNSTDIAGAAILGGVGASLKVYEEFDRQLRNVNSIAQLSEPNLQKLGDAVRGIAQDKDVRKGPRDLAAGLYDIYSVGYKGAKALDILRDSAKGAAAGNTDTAVAVDALTGVLNSNIRGAKTSRQVMDSLFQTVNDGKVSFPQLAGAIGQTLPFLKAGGVSLQEYGGYMADATAKSQKAEFATNNLNNLITKLAAPPKEAAKQFDKLGIKYGFAELKSVGFTAKMAEIIEKTKGSDDALKALFPDMQAFTAAQTIASNKMAGYNAMAANQAKATQGIGATARAAAKQNQGLSNDVDQAKKNMEEFGLIIATTVVPATTDLLKEVSSLFTWFKNLDRATQDNYVRTGLYAGAALILIGRLKSVIETVILVRRVYVGLQAQMMLTQAAGVASAGGIGLSWAGLAAAAGPLALVGIALGATIVAFKGSEAAGTMSAERLRAAWGPLGSFWDESSKKLNTFSTWLDKIGRNPIIDKLITLNGLGGLREFSTYHPEGDAAQAKSEQILANMKGGKAAPKSDAWKRAHGVPIAGRRASGGPVDGEKTYLVGENGPELFVPDSSGTIVPNGAFSSPPTGGIFNRANARVRGNSAARNGLRASFGSGVTPLMPTGDMIAASSGDRTAQNSEKIERQIQKVEDQAGQLRVRRIQLKGAAAKRVSLELAKLANQLRELRRRLKDAKDQDRAAGKDIKSLAQSEEDFASNKKSIGEMFQSGGDDERKARMIGNIYRKFGADEKGAARQIARLNEEFKLLRDPQLAEMEKYEKQGRYPKGTTDAKRRQLLGVYDRTAGQNEANEQIENIREARKALADLNKEDANSLSILKARRAYLEAHPGDEAGFETAQSRRDFIREASGDDSIKKLRGAGRGVEADVAVTNRIVNYDRRALEDLLKARSDSAKEILSSIKERDTEFGNDAVEAFKAHRAEAREILSQMQSADIDFGNSAVDAFKNLKALLKDTQSSADDLREALKQVPYGAAESFPALLAQIEKVKAAIPGRRDPAIADALEAAQSQTFELQRQIGESLGSRRHPISALEKQEMSWRYEDEVEKTKNPGKKLSAGESKSIQEARDGVRDLMRDMEGLGKTERLVDRVGAAFDSMWGEVLGGQKTFLGAMRDELGNSLQLMAQDVIKSQLRSFLFDLFGGALGGAIGKNSAMTGSANVNLRPSRGFESGGVNLSPSRGLGGLNLKSLGSFAVGLDRVPRDGYGYIHKNEAILPPIQAEKYRRERSAKLMAQAPNSGRSSGGSVTVVNNFHVGQIVASSPEEFQAKAQEMARRGSSRRSRLENSRLAASAVAPAQF